VDNGRYNKGGAWGTVRKSQLVFQHSASVEGSANQFMFPKSSQSWLPIDAFALSWKKSSEWSHSSPAPGAYSPRRQRAPKRHVAAPWRIDRSIYRPRFVGGSCTDVWLCWLWEVEDSLILSLPLWTPQLYKLGLVWANANLWQAYVLLLLRPFHLWFVRLIVYSMLWMKVLKPRGRSSKYVGPFLKQKQKIYSRQIFCQDVDTTSCLEFRECCNFHKILY